VDVHLTYQRLSILGHIWVAPNPTLPTFTKLGLLHLDTFFDPLHRNSKIRNMLTDVAGPVWFLSTERAANNAVELVVGFTAGPADGFTFEDVSDGLFGDLETAVFVIGFGCVCVFFFYFIFFK
jgi:hypothetical protein